MVVVVRGCLIVDVKGCLEVASLLLEGVWIIMLWFFAVVTGCLVSTVKGCFACCPEGLWMLLLDSFLTTSPLSSQWAVVLSCDPPLLALLTIK